MNWLPVGLLGGLVGVDATSFLQVMVSRPLVAAALTGLVAGRPVEALYLGILLEVFALSILPIGAARYPEAGTAAVAATAAYLHVAGAQPEAPLLLLAVIFALVWERIAGGSVNLLRRLNGWLVAGVEPVMDNGRRLERRHLLAIGADFVRGALVSLVGAGLGTIALVSTAPWWRSDPLLGAGALGISGAAMLGAALSLFGGWSERWRPFLLGALCGCLLLWLQ